MPSIPLPPKVFGGSNLLFDDPRPPIVIGSSPRLAASPLRTRRRDRRQHRLVRRNPNIIYLAADMPDFD